MRNVVMVEHLSMAHMDYGINSEPHKKHVIRQVGIFSVLHHPLLFVEECSKYTKHAEEHVDGSAGHCILYTAHRPQCLHCSHEYKKKVRRCTTSAISNLFRYTLLDK